MGIGCVRQRKGWAAQSQCGGCGQVCGELPGPPLALKPSLTQHWSFMAASEPKRTYLVVIDDSPEARVALRFAARRAAKTNGRIEILGVVEPQDFVQFGGVQAAIEEEQRLRIEGVVSASVGEILDESGVEANVIVQQGESAKTVREYLAGRDDVAALVLGAAPSGTPGVLVAHFTGTDAGKLPCPVMIIPGSLSDERLEQLS
jgi:nucleotide-binding universal stress UspA family protein